MQNDQTGKKETGAGYFNGAGGTLSSNSPYSAYADTYNSGNFETKIIVVALGQSKLMMYSQDTNPEPQVQITKHIEEITLPNSDVKFEGTIGSARSWEEHKNHTENGKCICKGNLQGWEVYKDSDKPIVPDGAKIKYEITLTNVGEVEANGSFKDVYYANELTSMGETLASYDVKLAVGEKKKIVVEKTVGQVRNLKKYRNTAYFTYKDTDKTISSSDYFTGAENEDITINKYVISVDDKSKNSRDKLTEESKENGPVDCGVNEGHVIEYEIKVTNNSEHEVTGKLIDEYNSAFEVEDASSLSSSSGNKLEGTWTLKSHETKTIRVKLTLKANCSATKYENKAIFKWRNKIDVELEKESKDWVKVYALTKDDSTLKKYITEVNDVEININRSGWSSGTKDSSPVEVKKGDIITYVIEFKNNTNISNYSESDHDGNYCYHKNKKYNKLEYMSCIDTFDAGLEFVGGSYEEGTPEENNITAEGNKITLKWKNIAYEETVKAKIKLRVTASNLKMTNLKNTVGSVEYAYREYTCKFKCDPTYCPGCKPNECSTAWFCGHVENEEKYIGYKCPGNHDKCHFNCSYKTETKNPTYIASDYVRLLEPVISGVVWLDNLENGSETGDGYKSGNETIANMNNESDQHVYVELYRKEIKGYNAAGEDISVTLKVGGEWVDADGFYSFGSVPKGQSSSVSLSDTHLEWSGEHKSGNISSYKYNDDNLYTYYVVFHYNGARYTTTVNHGVENLYVNNKYIMKNNFPTDSNASEIETSRDSLNKSLETISYNMAYAGTTNTADKKELTYTVNDDGDLRVSELHYDYEVFNDNSFGLPKSPATDVWAKSIDLFYKGGIDGDDTEYLKHINCGLVKRKEVDLSVTKDVVSAVVTINNHRTVYNYGKLGIKNNNLPIEGNVLQEPYALTVYKEDYEYRTSNYSPEIQTILNENNSFKSLYGVDNDLNIILGYKISIKNNSDSAIAVVREIIDYSSKELTYFDCYSNPTVIFNTSTESNYSNYKDEIGNDKGSKTDKFNITYLTTDDPDNVYKLYPKNSFTIWMYYTVNKDATGAILLDDINAHTDYSKFNIAEVGAYSFYEKLDGSGKIPAGLVDKNSNPGNAFSIERRGVNWYANANKFEDDTFETGIVVVTREDVDHPSRTKTPPGGSPDPDPNSDKRRKKLYYRNISGVVFEEGEKNAVGAKSGSLGSDGEKVGNGSFDSDKDIKAENVLVKLYEVVQKKEGGKVVEEYYVDTGLWCRTDKDGKYSFGEDVENINQRNSSGINSESTDDRYRLHAGMYVVRFIYGDEAEYLQVCNEGEIIKYSGQDFKSTKYTEVGNENADEILKPSAFTTASGNTESFVYETSKGGTVVASNYNATRHGDINKVSTTVGSNIYSVARDNEVRRLEVNMYSTTDYNLMDSTLKGGAGRNGLIQEEDKKILSARTSMFADTKTFDLDIEYCGDRGNERDQNNIDGTELKNLDKFYYSVRDINFGLVLRPQTKVQLLNDISEIQAITSDGKEILDIKYNINYYYNAENGVVESKATINKETSKGWDQIQGLNRDGNNLGYRYVNIDSKLLQGMQIQVTFQNAVANVSEIDHLNKDLEEKIEAKCYVDINITRNTGSGVLTDEYYIGGLGQGHASQAGVVHEALGLGVGDEYNREISEDYVEQGTKIDTMGRWFNDYLLYKESASKYTDLDYGKDELPEDFEKKASEINLYTFQSREYDYGQTYLYDLLYKAKPSIQINIEGIESRPEEYECGLINSDTKTSNYDVGISVGSANVSKCYSYTNIKNKVKSTYKIGDYLGNIYYTNEFSNEARVKTRIDQYINYLDPLLSYSNIGKVTTHVQLTNDEIAKKGLLSDIVQESGENVIIPAKKELDKIESVAINETDENGNQTEDSIANQNGKVDVLYDGQIYFSVENENVNPTFYKFLSPITVEMTIDKGEILLENLANIKIQGTRTLTSESSWENVEIRNLAEVIKVTNTAGRKVYEKNPVSSSALGARYVPAFLGNTTRRVNSNAPLGSSVSVSWNYYSELDTDSCEKITFSPPTGLTGQDAVIKTIVEETGNVLLIVIPVVIIIVGTSYIIIQFAKRKKFYK